MRRFFPKNHFENLFEINRSKKSILDNDFKTFYRFKKKYAQISYIIINIIILGNHICS
jgi:hypothetical protein